MQLLRWMKGQRTAVARMARMEIVIATETTTSAAADSIVAVGVEVAAEQEANRPRMTRLTR